MTNDELLRRDGEGARLVHLQDLALAAGTIKVWDTAFFQPAYRPCTWLAAA